MLKPASGKLPKGVLVDPEDMRKTEGFNKWFISKKGDVYSQKWDGKTAKTYKLHRIIMDCPVDMTVDHINRNPLDNRKKNLRICTQSQNSKNLSLKKNNTSGFPGVHWDKARNKWTARIKVEYKGIFLGRFDCINEAISMRLFAESYYFGEYAPNL